MSRPVFLFDLDGTLIDSRQDLTTAVNRVRALSGARPLSVSTVTGYVGDGIVKLLERALADIPGADARAAVPHMQAAYRECALDATRPYPGIPDILRELSERGHPLAVVTNKPEAVSRRILADLDLLPFLGAVVGGDTTPELKPAPRPLFDALEKLDGAVADAWMVGDNWTDLAAAQAAGLPCCFCEYGFGRRRDFDSAQTVHSPGEFIEFARSTVLRFRRKRNTVMDGLCIGSAQG